MFEVAPKNRAFKAKMNFLEKALFLNFFPKVHFGLFILSKMSNKYF